MTKTKVFLSGSVAAGRDFADNINMISNTLEELNCRIVTKGSVVNTTKRFTNSTTLSGRKNIMKRDKRWLRNSDLVVQEVSQYSHGVGYEHAYAESQNKPILMLRHKSLDGQRYSAFLDGTDYKKFMFSFYDEDDVKLVLIKFFKKYGF